MTEAIEFGRLSLWRDTAGLSDIKARDLAARLELRARAEDEAAVRDEYVGLLGVTPGERVLDVGCGSGAVTRVLARRVAPGGAAVGVDASPALLAVALPGCVLRRHGGRDRAGARAQRRAGPRRDGAGHPGRWPYRRLRL